MKTILIWLGHALPCWNRLLPTERRIKRVYLFISRPIDLPNATVTIYYAETKRAVYGFARQHRLKGHVKEGILPYDEYRQIAGTSYWIK